MTTPTPAAGPLCKECGATAVVSWQRRPTDTELADIVAAEQARRDQLLLLADPQQPDPQFGPLPTADDITRAVYACTPHAITLDAAAHIHANTCTAPNPANLPGCDCTPEPLPPAPPADPTPASNLPADWQSGTA